MKIKNITLLLVSALGFFSAATQASETLIASASNLQSCHWSYLYGGGGPITDGLYCYSGVTNKTNKVLERTTYGSWCQIANVSVGYTLGGQSPGQICPYFQVYKVDVLPVTNVRAQSGSSININWTQSSLANGYEIYRNGSYVTKVGFLSYSDSTATPGVATSYAIRACLGENCSALTYADTYGFIPSLPAQVFSLPKKDGVILGVDPNPVANTTYFAGDTAQYVLDSTAHQFCVDQGFLGTTGYSTQSNYGNGHKFAARGAWYTYGGGPFTQISSVTCAK